MNKNEVKIIIHVEGADKARSDLKSVQNATTTGAGAIAKGVFIANAAFEALKGTIGLVTDVVKKAFTATISFVKDSIGAFQEYEKAMITLEIIAPKFGVKIEDAQKAAKDLGRELRIGTAPAASGLQNLLKSGLNLDQATELMRRFNNEALTGKNRTLDQATAVDNLTFAYMTSNSMLGNASGIAENFEDIIESGRKALIADGVAVQDITEDMAKYRGMIDLTNLTLGSAEKLQGTYSDNMISMKNRINDLKVVIGGWGNAAMTIFSKVAMVFVDKFVAGFESKLPVIKQHFEKLSGAIKELGNTMGLKQVDVDGFAKSLGELAGEAVIKVIDFIVGFVNALRENWPYIKFFFGVLTKSIKGLITQIDILTGTKNPELKTSFGGVGKAIDELGKKYGLHNKEADKTKTKAEELGGQFGDIFTEKLTDAIFGISGMVTSLTSIITWFNENKDDISTFITNINNLAGAITSLSKAIGDIPANAGAKLGDLVGGLQSFEQKNPAAGGPINWLMNWIGFNKGGIVGAQKGMLIGGNSYSGDRIPIMANSGEMIITREQQGGLFRFLRGLANPNRTINFNAPINFAGNRSEAQQVDFFSKFLLKSL